MTASDPSQRAPVSIIQSLYCRAVGEQNQPSCCESALRSRQSHGCKSVAYLTLVPFHLYKGQVHAVTTTLKTPQMLPRHLNKVVTMQDNELQNMQ